ncbi:hypothetical protein SAY87_011805 [Trapa incisa]|uniref:CCT domain-containing protein n=1 Tax=Trapa incisa TaxID=236973 RepID=A0AAN7JJL2_9MYRT|nr:hypothetical protein SAY87_011805 [Trapa incisa]
MYAETDLLFPSFQNFSPEIHTYEEFYRTEKANPSLNDLVQASSILEYDLGAEGDLFKAPEPIIEEPFIGSDPMASAMSMIACGNQDLSAHQCLESFQGGSIMSDVFYDCRKDLLAKVAIEDTPLTELMDIKDSLVPINTDGSGDKWGNISFQKSGSSSCLSSMEGFQWSAGSNTRFLDFSGVDLEAVYGLRRAFSEGDIKTLGVGNRNSEERQEKLSRYRSKRTKRNFGRKIKYACRKALADSQPRIRGRFAKTECETSKKQ